MIKKNEGILFGSVISVAGTIVLVFTYFTLFFSSKAQYFAPNFCHNLTNPPANCIDFFNEGKAIFAFVVPFILFMPIGYIIVSYSKSQGIWVCQRKWMISSVALLVFAIFSAVILYFEIPFVLYFVIGSILTGAIATLAVTGWTVFFHNRKHLLRNTDK